MHELTATAKLPHKKNNPYKLMKHVLLLKFISEKKA